MSPRNAILFGKHHGKLDEDFIINARFAPYGEVLRAYQEGEGLQDMFSHMFCRGALAGRSSLITLMLGALIAFGAASAHAQMVLGPSVTMSSPTNNGTEVFVSVPTISTARYDVQTTTDLISGAWSTIVSNVPGTGGVMNIDCGAVSQPPTIPPRRRPSINQCPSGPLAVQTAGPACSPHLEPAHHLKQAVPFPDFRLGE